LSFVAFIWEKRRENKIGVWWQNSSMNTNLIGVLIFTWFLVQENAKLGDIGDQHGGICMCLSQSA
jgi:hypothetical protein